MSQHPLIGRYLVWDEPDRKHWTLGRFKAEVNEYIFLVQALQPADGEQATCGDYLVNLNQIIIDDNYDRAFPIAQIFDDFEAVRDYMAEFNGPAAEKVVKLVKS